MHNNNGEIAGSVLGLGTWLGSHLIHFNLNIGNPIHTELMIEGIRLGCSIIVPVISYFTVYFIKKYITKEK